MPRNPLIAKMFFWIKYAEDVGSGTSKIIQWCKEWGLPEPTYEEAGASFVTVFHNPKLEDGTQKTRVETRVETRVKTRVKTGEKILQIIKENPAVTVPELSESTGLTIKGVEWNIKELKKKELLKRIGSNKGGHWEVLKEG